MIDHTQEMDISALISNITEGWNVEDECADVHARDLL